MLKKKVQKLIASLVLGFIAASPISVPINVDAVEPMPLYEKTAAFWGFDAEEIASAPPFIFFPASPTRLIARDLTENTLKKGNTLYFSGYSRLGGGKVGGTLYFTPNNYAVALDDPSLNFGRNNLSIVTWIKTTTRDCTILDKRDSSGIGYHMKISNGALLFQLADGSGWTNFTYSASQFPTYNVCDGNWHLIAVTVDRNSGGRIYVDGKILHSFDPSIRPGSITNTASLLVGKHKDSAQADFTGYLDEMIISAKKLDFEEINDIYEMGSVGIDKVNINKGLRLLANWEFNNGDAYDTSGNGIHGELKGAVIENDYAKFDGSSYIEIPYSTGAASRLLPSTSNGLKKLVIECEVLMDSPNYYNFIFQSPSYGIAAPDLGGPHARLGWNLNGVKSQMSVAGGRWGSGPDLWANPETDGQAFYWGWELYGTHAYTSGFFEGGTWRYAKITYNGTNVNHYATSSTDVCSYTFPLAAVNGLIKAASSTSSAIIGRGISEARGLKGKINYIKIYAED